MLETPRVGCYNTVQRAGRGWQVAIVVQKYGGTSVGNTKRLQNVAKRVVATSDRGNSVVVVVSALGDTTDELIRQAHAINAKPPEREFDVLLSTGEQMSSALLAMAIDALGHPAISFTGAQVGIMTDATHTKARIVEVRAKRIKEELDRGRIVIVAGFQGVTPDEDITTLGRGGSDTTAVALAAQLGADVCEVYTDVEGIFTADPRLVPKARKLAEVSYDEMLEMAATGARVLQLRSVEYARNNKVTLHVRSSFSDEDGTIVKEGDESMEQAIISGVTHDSGEAKVTILGVPDKPGVAASVFRVLADRTVNVDMIIQNVSEQGFTDISFTLAKEDLSRAKDAVADVVAQLGAKGASYDEDIAKVTLVGAGMRTHPGVAATMFEVLASNGINIEMISTSSIKISCVIAAEHVGTAVQALHEKFGLAGE